MPKAGNNSGSFCAAMMMKKLPITWEGAGLGGGGDGGDGGGGEGGGGGEHRGITRPGSSGRGNIIKAHGMKSQRAVDRSMPRIM